MQIDAKMKDKIFLYVCVATSLVMGLSCSKTDYGDEKESPDNTSVIKRDVPENEGVKIAYKKARQFTDIKWRPKNYMPST